MAKIRGVKPDYWTDEDIVDLSIPARLLFIGMWNYACDNGHLQDKPKQIKMRVMPGDEVNVTELLREIEAQDVIQREPGWITIPNLTKHQKPDRRYFTTCEKEGCNAPPETVSQREARRVHAVQTPGAPSAHVGCTPGAHVDGDGDGEVMVKGSDGDTPPRAAKPKRASQFPADFAPNDTHHKIAADEGVDIRREFVKFREHHTAKGTTFKDWPAAFRSWLHKAGEYRGGNVRQMAPRTDEHGQPVLPPPPTGSEWMT